VVSGRAAGWLLASNPGVVRRAAIALALLCGFARAGHADDADSKRADDDVHVGAIALESALVLAVPTAYYWDTKEHQAIDWTLDWDWESWKSKLLSTEKLKFDTNPFHVNALRHPLVGVLDYQIARTNGLDAISSMGFAYASGVLWEFLIEFRENPSINDMIANGAGGIAIGEPLYQIAQLWRGPAPSVLDRAHTAIFSPWDAVHDTYRSPRARSFRAWRSITLGAGSVVRWSNGSVARELALDADFDVVAHPAFVTAGERSGPISAGAWSRLHVGASIGDGESTISQTFLHSRTTFAGSYQQSKTGTGRLAAIGTGFTYRYDRLAGDRDRLGIFHLAGPQLQLTFRRPSRALWIDFASYGDFALVDPIALGPVNEFPRPPPYFTSVQADGYYYGAGFSASLRVRAATGPWHLDTELAAHQFWQIDGHTLHNAELADGPTSELTATGMEDLRVFGRVKVGYRPSRWGLAATADAAYRRGESRARTRTLEDIAIGLVLELDY
jgi:hypothetical protein